MLLCILILYALVRTGQEATIPVENGSLYSEATGNGPPVILIHGGQMELRMWEPQVEAPAGTHTIIRYDAGG